MVDPFSDWTVGDRHTQIDKAMTAVSDAFDRFYFHSRTNEDLMRNTAAVAKAINDVRRHARLNLS